MKIQKKNFFWGGGGRGGVGSGVGFGGIRVDVNEDLKFFGKIHKKKKSGGSGGEGSVGGGGGVGLMGGQGGCERNVGGRG